MPEKKSEKKTKAPAFEEGLDQLEKIGRGNHTRFVADLAKTAERLAAKKAQAGL